MLTTVDNPFDPFTQYAEWVNWDEQLCGYYTNSYLARIARVGDELSEADFDVAYENAVDEIVRENPNGLYRKVAEPAAAAA
jgi:hypothetical protein